MSCSCGVISQCRVGTADRGAVGAEADRPSGPSPRTDLSPGGRPGGANPLSPSGISGSPAPNRRPGRARSPRPDHRPATRPSSRTGWSSGGSPMAGPDSLPEIAAPRTVAPPNPDAVATTSVPSRARRGISRRRRRAGHAVTAVGPRRDTTALDHLVCGSVHLQSSSLVRRTWGPAVRAPRPRLERFCPARLCPLSASA